jgi:hypothetical protein
VIYVVSHQGNVRRVNPDFGEKTVRKLVGSVIQISAVKLMDDAHHVKMDFGANFVRILAVKVVQFQRVAKIMGIAVFAKAVIGELIVTKPACTTAPRQAVVD